MAYVYLVDVLDGGKGKKKDMKKGSKKKHKKRKFKLAILKYYKSKVIRLLELDRCLRFFLLKLSWPYILIGYIVEDVILLMVNLLIRRVVLRMLEKE
jgi:hypothetical protein